MDSKSKPWVKLGTLRRKDDAKKSYIVLDKEVEVRVNGVKVDLGKYQTVKLVNPLDGLQTRLEKGSITQEEYDKRVSKLQEKSIMYELTVVPSQD